MINSHKINFSTSFPNFNEDSNNNKIYLDLSNNLHIIKREGGLYKIYKNLFINDKLVDNLTKILEELYNNNKFTEFNFYFLIKPDFEKIINFNVENLNKHFSQYPSYFLNQEITRIYKNTGLINSTSILISMSLCDINNLNNISKEIYKEIKNNIEEINKNLELEQDNTIINYLNKVEENKELLLFINANYKKFKEMFL